MRRAPILGALVLAAWPMLASALLPDIDRGIRAYENGDLAAAEANLRPLAERGYAEAQHYLARVYRTLDTPEAREQARHWFSEALDTYPTDVYDLAKLDYAATGNPQALAQAQTLLRKELADGNPRALSRLIRLYRDYPSLATDQEIGQLLGRALSTGEAGHIAAVISWYADNQGVRQNYVRLIELCARHVRRVPDCLPELARNARANADQARLTQRVETALARYPSEDVDADLLDEVASELLTNSIAQPPAIEPALRLLRTAAPHHARAKARLGELLIDRPDLALADEDSVALLRAADEAGVPEATLTLGRAYMNGEQVAPEPDLAHDYLARAAERLPAGKFSLARYYMRGFGGDDGFLKAADLLLVAARDGYERADLDLARLYSEGRGVKPNLGYAYGFALIAANNGVDGSGEMLGRLNGRIDDAARRTAEQIGEREYHARADARPQRPGLALNDLPEPGQATRATGGEAPQSKDGSDP